MAQTPPTAADRRCRRRAVDRRRLVRSRVRLLAGAVPPHLAGHRDLDGRRAARLPRRDGPRSRAPSSTTAPGANDPRRRQLPRLHRARAAGGLGMQRRRSSRRYPVMGAIKWSRQYHAHARDAAARRRRPGRAPAVRRAAPGHHHARCSWSSWSLFGAIALAVGGAVHPGRRAHRAAPTRRRSSPSRRPVENDSGFAMLFRFGIVPMFLFSGTFFPVSQLPDWLEPVAWACRCGTASTCAATSRSGHRALRLGARCTSPTCVLWAVVGYALAARRRSSGGWSRERADPATCGSHRRGCGRRLVGTGRRALPDRAQRAGLPHGLAGAALRHLRADLLPVLGRRRGRPSWSATSSCPAARWSATPRSSRRRCSRPQRHERRALSTRRSTCSSS